MSATTSPARILHMLLGCTLLVIACDGGPSEPLTVVLPADATILIHGGDNQVAPAGTTLPVPLSVRVTAAGGRPVEGVKIRWTLSLSSGTVAGLHGSLTDDRGIASARRSLGASAGRFTTNAVIEQSGAAVTFTTVSQIQGATRMLPLPGDVLIRPSDTVLAALPAPLRVLIQDHEERPVPGVTVGWSATGGSVSSVSSVSDAQGIAEMTFTRGPNVGQHVVRASVAGLGGSPISFTTNTVAGRPVTLEKIGGDEQAAGVFTVLAAPFVVHVVDAYGNSVVGAPVAWIVAEDTLAQSMTGANLAGETRPVALYTHHLDGEEGVHVISAAVSGILDIPPVSFTYTALRAPPVAVGVHDWDYYWGYYCYYGGCGFSPSYVTVQPDQAVTWTWQGSQGHNVVFEDDPTAPVSSALKTTGSHTRIFDTPGTYRYRCTAHSGSFTEGMVGTVVVSGPPTDATTLEKVSGDNQAGTVGSALALPFVVHVADAEGHSVAGVTVAWIAESDTGPEVVARSTTHLLLPGELRPLAYHYHVLGSDHGVKVITASVEDRPDIAPVSFTYTALPAPDAMVGVYDWDDSWYSYCWYGGCGFDPSHVTVSAGRTVTWTWHGIQGHNVVFEDVPTQPVSSATQATGVHTRTFNAAGTYRYRCTLHSTSFTEGMVGAVVVL